MMPKLSCPCGYVHNLSPIPDAGWITIQDAEYEVAVQAIVQQHLTNADPSVNENEGDLFADQYKLGRLYECPACGRLMWSLPGDRCTNFKIYRPE